MQLQRILRFSSSASRSSQPLSQAISALVPRFFTSSSSSSSSAGSGFSAGYSSSRCLQQDEESWNVRVSVWWDIETCKLPEDVNAYKVSEAITAAIKSSGIVGPIISITAFGDLSNLSEDDQYALFHTGITLLSYGSVGGGASGFMNSVSKVRLPAHVFLISNDGAFASALHRLRIKNYNILLASETDAPDDLSSAATMMWDWCSLVKGKTVTGIRLNQPPYGPYSYWDGHYMVPLQDQFATDEQSNSAKIEESPPLAKILLQPDSGSGPSTPFDQRVGEKGTDKSKSSGFFDRILKWFKICKKDVTAAKHGDEPMETRAS